MPKFQRNEAYYALRWFLRRLIPERVNDLDLAVYFRKMKPQNGGQCWNYDDPLKYTVVINSDHNRRDNLISMAHEAVHIYQYVSGKMKDVSRSNKVQWKNDLFENEYEGSGYWNSPWEVEAREKQEKLARAYIKHISRRKSTKFFR